MAERPDIGGLGGRNTVLPLLGDGSGRQQSGVIDLDNNATTRPAAAVIAGMVEVLQGAWHNPSSVHRAGQDAKRRVELARAQVAALIGAAARNIVFTSGGTEAIDLAIRGAVGAAMRARPGPQSRPMNLVTTPIEHSAVRELAEEMDKAQPGRERVERRVCAVARDGTVRAADVIGLIDDDTAVVSVQWCNNETGAVQPVGEIARVCRERGVAFHCDATQWVGKMPARVVAGAGGSAASGGEDESLCEADFVTFSPHKFHGPKGVGVLYCRTGARFVPQLQGTQELGRRGGTENVPGIVGAGIACELAGAWLAEGSDAAERRRLAGLRDRFERAVIEGVAADGALAERPVINGPTDGRRLWNVTNLAFPTLEAEALLLALSERGICASAGAACSSGSLDPSPVLLAMGVEPRLAHGSIRFSLSRDADEAEVMGCVPTIVQCVRRVAASG